MTTRNNRRIKFNGRQFLEAGLNVTDNPLIVPPNEMVDATNILVGATLARKKRGGQVYFNTDDSDETATYPVNPKNNGGSDGPPILGLYEFWRYDSGSGAPKSTLMVRQDDKIWAIDARTGTATDITGALSLPTVGRITFQTFEGNLYWTGTDPSEGYNKWDGVSASAVAIGGGSQPPDGTPRFVTSHQGRMFGWGVPGFPYRLYYSEFFDAETWATNPLGTTGTAAQAGSLDLDPFGDPEGIVGAVSFQDKLYVFMRRAIFEISGNTINDFRVRTVNRQIGALGHHTIVPIANDIIYASERGVLTLSSTDKAIESEYGFASRPVSKIWNDQLNRTLPNQFSATYDEQENLYLIAAPSKGSSANDIILAYAPSTGIWTNWEGHKARTLSTYIIDGVNRVIAGREDGIISVTGDPSRLDLGEQYTAKYRTGILFPGEEIDIEHLWKHITALFSTDGTANVTVNVYVDSTLVNSVPVEVESGQDLLGSSFVLGQSKLGKGVFVPRTIPVEGQGYGLQIEVIYNSEADIESYGFMVEAVPADHRIRGG